MVRITLSPRKEQAQRQTDGSHGSGEPGRFRRSVQPGEKCFAFGRPQLACTQLCLLAIVALGR